jgi:glutamyl endopeptidase
MSRLMLAVGACAVALVGCSRSKTESSTAPSGPAPSAVSAADAATGVNNDGVEYAVRPLQGSPEFGAEPGAAGSREMSPTTDSAGDFARLSQVKPVARTFGPDAAFGPEQIIGADDRRKVTNTTRFPEGAQVLVILGSGGRCSGALIGKDLVITAGHCVHSGGSGGQWQPSATVYPGKNGAASPYGSCSAKRFYSVLGWTRDKNPEYDFGAIKLNCDVGNRTGWLGFFWQSASLVNMPARISSYPGDKPLEQWTHTDKVRSESARQTRYFTDTMPGNSGSGVFAETGAPGNCGACVHTVHAYGSPSTNSGTRITQPLFDNLIRWKAEP